MNEVILRNSRAEQYLCAAKKNFIEENGHLSESHTKTVICHFSDLHADWKRLDNILELAERYRPAFAIHTGDLVCWDLRDDTSPFFEKIRTSSTPIYNCLGNHDTFMGEVVIKNEVLHERFIKPLPGITTTGKGYYYVDLPEHNIRLIALNDYENDSVDHFSKKKYELLDEQCAWLCDVLAESAEKGLGVIIASHECDEPITPGANSFGFCQRTEPYPWSIPKPRESFIIADIVDAFRNGKSICREYTQSASGSIVHINCEFKKKGEFICYMNGHRHGDYIGYLETHPDQLSLGMSCSGCFPEGYHNIGEEVSDLARIPGTVSEDLINYYVLDREKKTITVVRFGAYVTDELNERLAARYKYDK